MTSPLLPSTNVFPLYVLNSQVANLVLAYETILDHLSSTSPPSPLYFFAETGFHEWLVLAKKIQSVLLAKGLVGSEFKFDPTPNCVLLPGQLPFFPC